MFLRAADFEVTLCDLEQSFLDRALAVIAKNLDREVAKQKSPKHRKPNPSSGSPRSPTARDLRLAISSSKPLRRNWKSRQSYFTSSTASAGRK